MTNYKHYVADKKKKLPKDIRKLMGPEATVAERQQQALDENPGSYCISWSEIFACAWSSIKTNYKTNGIFPPSFIVDHKNTPGNDNYQTEAAINVTWFHWKDKYDNVKQIIPRYLELRVYYRNVMQCIYDKFKHYVPESAMIAYMVNIAFHEFHHYLDYYDLSFDIDEKLADKYTADEYYASTGTMYDFISSKDVVTDERETERAAILDTLAYMNYSYTGGYNGKGRLLIIPGGPYDQILREKNGANYRMASLMCEHLWLQWLIDFTEDLTDEMAHEYKLRQRKIFVKFKNYYDKHPQKMLIID